MQLLPLQISQVIVRKGLNVAHVGTSYLGRNWLFTFVGCRLAIIWHNTFLKAIFRVLSEYRTGEEGYRYQESGNEALKRINMHTDRVNILILLVFCLCTMHNSTRISLSHFRAVRFQQQHVPSVCMCSLCNYSNDMPYGKNSKFYPGRFWLLVQFVELIWICFYFLFVAYSLFVLFDALFRASDQGFTWVTQTIAYWFLILLHLNIETKQISIKNNYQNEFQRWTASSYYKYECKTFI